MTDFLERGTLAFRLTAEIQQASILGLYHGADLMCRLLMNVLREAQRGKDSQS